ncbi:MAG: hypothetical protein NXI20_07540 [bacterium]|nr:hypothetical protein [bacterium]
MKKLVYVFVLGMIMSFGFSACSSHDEVLDEMETPLLENEATDGDEDDGTDPPVPPSSNG